MKLRRIFQTVLVAFLAVLTGLALLYEHWRGSAGKPSWIIDSDLLGWSILSSIAVGIVLSVWETGLVIKHLVLGRPVNLFGFCSAAPLGIKLGAYLGGLASFPFALFLGIVVGGTLGGGWGVENWGQSKDIRQYSRV